MTQSQRIVLARTPNGAPVAADFAFENMDSPDAEPGKLLVRVLALSLDPYIGSRLQGRHMSGPAPKIGELIPGGGVAQVVESKAEGFAAGDVVVAETGWQTHALIDPAEARKVDASVDPVSLHLGVCGMPGLTAHASVNRLAQVREGDRVLVSSAAGPVGGTVGQLSRIAGATKVVGTAGSDEKCRLVVERYGFDDCINYRSDDWQDRLADAFPGGITVYHDNVGGEMLDAALANLADYGRVVLCGLISQYNLPAGQRPSGPNPGIYILKRAILKGLVVYDYMDEADDFARTAARHIAEGKLRFVEDSADGLAAASAQFEKLMRGDNIGKTVVQVASL